MSVMPGLAGRLRVGLMALGLALAVAGGAHADALDQLDKGPAVGAALPHPLTLADQSGTPHEFATLTGKRGLIVLFSRSFEW